MSTGTITEKFVYSRKRLFFFSFIIALSAPLIYYGCSFGGCGFVFYTALFPSILWAPFNALINLGLVVGYALVIFFTTKKFLTKKYFLAILFLVLLLIPAVRDSNIYDGVGITLLRHYLLNIFLVGAENLKFFLDVETPLYLVNTMSYILYTAYLAGMMWVAGVISGISKVKSFFYYRIGFIFLIVILMGAYIFNYTFAEAIFYNRIYAAKSVVECQKPEVARLTSSKYKIRPEPKNDLNIKIDLPEDATGACIVAYAIKSRDVTICNELFVYAPNFKKCILAYKTSYSDPNPCSTFDNSLIKHSFIVDGKSMSSREACELRMR